MKSCDIYSHSGIIQNTVTEYSLDINFFLFEFSQFVVVNMALRSSDEDSSNSPVPGLNYFWQEAEKSPTYEWEQWIQLFEVAVLARHSISVSELTREVTQDNPRIAAMMGNLEEEPAKRKVTSLLYISIGKTGRKMLMDKFPHINILLIQLNNFLQHCVECFQTRRNRTLDRHTFLSRKQKPTESLL